MEEIKAGVVLVNRFCVSDSDAFKGYVDYIDREEAVRNIHFSEFSLYNDYMGNPRKTSCLFTSEKDQLTEEEKQELKSCFQLAQDKGSLMWQTVISFDNRWLEQNGLYFRRTNTVDEKKIHEITRSAMNALLEKEGLNSALWSAAIHYNTDNIHIHIATVEPIPTRKMKVYDENLERVGKFQLKNIEYAKSKVVNKIMQEQEENKKINTLIRENLVKGIKEFSGKNNQEWEEDFKRIYSILPSDKRQWNYNNNSMKNVRPYIDRLCRKYIENYRKEEFTELNALLEVQQAKFQEAYGQGKGERNHYADNKIKDLFQRMGNALLKEMKNYDKMITKLQTEKEEERKIEVDIEEGTEEIIEIGMEEETEEIIAIGIEEEIEENVEMGIEEGTEEKIEIGTEEGRKEKIEADTEGGTIQGKKRGRDTRSEMYSSPKEEEIGQIRSWGWNGKKQERNNKDYYCSWEESYAEGRAYLYGKKGVEQNFEKALNLFEEEVNKGNVIAMYEMGRIYENGRVVEKDDKKSQEYYGKAFKGFESLQITPQDDNDFWKTYIPYRLGKMYDGGKGVEQDYLKANEYYIRSSNMYALYSRGKLYYYGNGVEQDFDMAFSLFSIAQSEKEEKKKLNPYIELELAKMYEKGLGTEQNIEASKHHYEKAYEEFVVLNEMDADDKLQYRIGYMRYYGIGTEKDIELAKKFLEESANVGNTDAQLLRAKICIQEKDEENIGRIVEWLEASAEKGNDKAQYILGSLYLEGELIEQDTEKAINYWKQAAEKKNQYALYKLGKAYLEGTEVSKDVEVALKYLEESCELGNEHAQYTLGMFYLKGSDTPKDIEKAVDYLERAADQGNEYAKYVLGKLYLGGEGVSENLEKALKYLNESADQGNALARYTLAKLYLEGEKVEKDVEKGLEYLESAAEQENATAQYKLGKIYLEGKIVPQDIEKALDYLEKAEKQGNEHAQYTLGMFYLKGIDTKKDMEKAVDYLERAADQGNEYAKYTLGKLYLGEEGVREDLEKALRYLNESADQGNTLAQYALAKLYLEGEKVEKDVEKGLEYLESAAEQENTAAQYKLGKIYLEGKIVPRDTEKALDYLKKAGEQRNEFALYTLGVIYSQGKYVKRDRKKAEEYFKQAAECGNVDFETLQKQMGRRRGGISVMRKFSFALEKSTRQAARSMGEEYKKFEEEYDKMLDRRIRGIQME